MPQSRELPEWVPEWYPKASAPASEPRKDPPGDGPATDPPHASGPTDDCQDTAASPSQAASIELENVDGFKRAPPKQIIVTPNPDRTVKRKLRGIHLFMITINGTLGTGLYWRGGQILELGGPLAVLLSFFLVGLLSWAVMQCITEMLCIWPIPGALSVYVSEFVDDELGIAVGIAYWFTYSVSFAALIATSAAEFNFWPGVAGNKGIEGGIIYLCIPFTLVLVNAFGIEIYGLIEVVSGTIKLLFLAVIMIALIAINLGAGPSGRGYLGAQYWSSPTAIDTDAANNWGTALLMSMSIATFAYVGVEIVAASALEAEWPQKIVEARTNSDLARPSNDTLIGKTVKFSAIFISVLATIAYSLSGLLATFDIARDDCQLPRLSWINATATSCQASSPPSPETNTASAFVAIAYQSRVPHLADVFNAFLVFTCLTCANTNLYVASRTLFGLTSRLDGGTGQPWVLRLLAWFGRTNHRKVPMRAMIFSALAFCWVPFLQLSGGTSTDTPIGMFIEVLAEMGSVGVLIVWACECLAFIRYYHCIDRHRSVLEAQKFSQVRRWSREDYHDYPYRGHGQPLLAYAALAGCLFILVVANGTSLWKGFHPLPFLSSYLIVFVFLGIWALLKIVRGSKWSFVDLSNPQKVVKKLRDLHDIRQGAT